MGHLARMQTLPYKAFLKWRMYCWIFLKKINNAQESTQWFSVGAWLQCIFYNSNVGIKNEQKILGLMSFFAGDQFVPVSKG